MVYIKRRTWEVLGADNHDPNDHLNTVVDSFILLLIVTSVVAVILESVDGIHKPYEQYFHWFEVFVVGVFTAEYVLRMWSCTIDERYSHPIIGRIKFFFNPMSLIDLAAFLPFFLAPYILHLAGGDFLTIRMFRLGRIFRLLKAARYIESMNLLVRVVVKQKDELIVSGFIMMMLLIVSSSIMYALEHDIQPDKFPNIPFTMYWASTTLTTVGYGDIYPVTPLGKMFSVLVQMFGIGMFALPTAILGASFHEELKLRRKPLTCQKCGHVHDGGGDHVGQDTRGIDKGNREYEERNWVRASSGSSR